MTRVDSGIREGLVKVTCEQTEEVREGAVGQRLWAEGAARAGALGQGWPDAAMLRGKEGGGCAPRPEEHWPGGPSGLGGRLPRVGWSAGF